MTVCIAVRSEGMVLLASDQMLTAGDIQFEPPVAKVLSLTSSIFIMFSGDSAFYTEIFQDLIADVRQRVSAEPDNWLTVKEVADLYVKHRNSAKLRRAEARILAPLNLDRDSFLSQQSGMNPDLVNKIAEDLVNFPVPALDVILAGVDQRMGYALPSIYVVIDGEVSCADTVSFAAIGSGARHAESQFMLSRYSYQTPNAEALLDLYTAKKNAEIAPGVGRQTDLIGIGPQLGQFFKIEGPILTKLDEVHRKIKFRDDGVRRRARAEIARYVEGFAKKTVEQQAEPAEGTAPEAAAEKSGTKLTEGDT